MRNFRVLKKLVKSLKEEAIDYEKGNGKARVKSYMGVSKKTVEAWECGRTHPTGPVFRLLDILATEDLDETDFVVGK